MVLIICFLDLTPAGNMSLTQEDLHLLPLIGTIDSSVDASRSDNDDDDVEV